MEQWEQRLVRRYNPLGQIQISWTCEDQTPQEPDAMPNSVDAMILDVSVTGMLVDLPPAQQAEPGDMVDISWSGHHAAARVAHSARHQHLPGGRVVGVEIISMSPGFEAALYDAVAVLRHDHGQLAQQWYRQG